jgi:hypothetical protein
MMMVRELLGATYPEIKVLACLCILWFGVRAAFAYTQMMKQKNEKGERGCSGRKIYVLLYLSIVAFFFGVWKMVKCAAPSPLYGMKKYRVKYRC